MQILVQLQHRAGTCEAGQLLEQDLKGALLLPLRAEIEGRIALPCGKPEELPDQRERFVPLIGSLTQQYLKLRQLVLRLVARGLSNREIGAALTISEHTAANHVRSILRKTGSANRTEAASYAHRRGLAER